MIEEAATRDAGEQGADGHEGHGDDVQRSDDRPEGRKGKGGSGWEEESRSERRERGVEETWKSAGLYCSTVGTPHRSVEVSLIHPVKPTRDGNVRQNWTQEGPKMKRKQRQYDTLFS